MGQWWFSMAACLGHDADIFFSESQASIQEAKAICGECEVEAECLLYALETQTQMGIFGSMTPSDRARAFGGEAIRPVKIRFVD